MNSPLVQIRQYPKNSGLKFYKIPDHESQSIVSSRLKRRFCLNEVMLILEKQDIAIVVKELFLTDFTSLLYQIIPDFDYLVKVINVTICKVIQI